MAVPSTWLAILARADAAVAADVEAGFTTLIGFCLDGEKVVGASCGDSAVLALGRGVSPCAVTAKQVKNPPVGSGAAFFTPFVAALTKPWIVLAMSDGVWKYVGWDRVVKAATEGGQGLVEKLQAGARLPGSGLFPDDFTIVLFEGSA